MTGNELIIGNKTYSSWSMRAAMMLARTPLPYRERKLALDTPAFAAEIAALSPSRRVPALHVDGQVLWDSLAIGEYLAERFPGAGLWPRDPVLRAHARCVAAEMHAGFEALRSALPFNCRALGRQVALGAAVMRDIERITALWRGCFAIRPDASGGLLGGFTIADAMYVPVALRFRTYGVALDPPCANYLEWCVADEHVSRWLADAALEREVIEGEEVGRAAPQ